MNDHRILDQIERAAEDFGDHENVSQAKITRWVSQFDADDRPLAAKILDSIKYFSAANIRGMTRQLVEIVLQEAAHASANRIVFVPVGGVTSGSLIIARTLDSIRRRTKGSWKIKSMADVESLEPEKLDAIVFVDDFSGTGDTLTEWWNEVEPLVLPKNAEVLVGLLVMYFKAREKILNFAYDALCVDELSLENSALSGNSRHFNSVEQETLLKYCRRTGVSDRFVKGYGDCGLLIAFKHGCPNNSLPVLWHDSDSWKSLFVRRAL